MNVNDLRPAKEFAVQFGCKMTVYGKPGSGKTPVCVHTAPRPLLLAAEPGMLTLRNSTCPTYPAFTGAKNDEFFNWWFGSNESKAFDTLIWDSASEYAEMLVREGMGGTSKGGNEAHGMRVYGKMARDVMARFNQLYFQQQKHIILITKMDRLEVNGSMYHRPYFPGKYLPTAVPHLFDVVTCLGNWNVPGAPGVPGETKAFRTKETYDYQGRDRSGNLLEFEPPDVSRIISKVMA